MWRSKETPRKSTKKTLVVHGQTARQKGGKSKMGTQKGKESVRTTCEGRSTIWKEKQRRPGRKKGGEGN